MIELPSFNHIKILVVGDVMLDRYWYGNAARISPEAPVPIVRVNQIEDRPGGAGNVALNIRALGGQVEMLGIVGEDEAANVLQQRLKVAGVTSYFQHEASLPTITKLRVISQNQQLIRLDFEHQYAHLAKDYMEDIYDKLVPKVDLIILSDYDKGTLSNSQTLIQKARKYGKPILVDPKGNDFKKYQGATLLTPNLKEFEQIVGTCQDEKDFAQKGLQLIDELQLSALLITRGSKGMTLLRHNYPELHLPAKAREVYDVTGAGDTVIAVLATAIAAGQSLPNATALANYAASIVVGRVGAASVTVPELRRKVQKATGTVTGVMSAAQLQIAVDDAKAHAEKIIITDGVFDILSLDHVKLLRQAKAQGKRLIVLVYDDATVARLYGTGQPLNTVERRIAIVAALGCVDWVVPVDDQNITELLENINPDCFVSTAYSEFAKINPGFAQQNNKIVRFDVEDSEVVA